MSTGGEIMFLVCGLVAVVTAVLTITMRTPLRAAMALLGHVVSLAGLYLTLHAHLLAAIQLIVYAGAIVVLFVFVIMLMGPGAIDSRSDARGWVVKTIGGAMIALLCGGIAASVGEATAETRSIPVCTETERECGQYGGVESMSRALFRDAAIPFELVSLLLLVAIIAAVAVARGRSADEKKTVDDLDAIKRAPRPFLGDPAGPPLNPAKLTMPVGQPRADEEPAE